jgi:hypothetical protein
MARQFAAVTPALWVLKLCVGCTASGCVCWDFSYNKHPQHWTSAQHVTGHMRKRMFRLAACVRHNDQQWMLVHMVWPVWWFTWYRGLPAGISPCISAGLGFALVGVL